MSLVAVSSLVDELLADQQRLTAVERFAQFHAGTEPSRAGHYRSLIPLNRPAAGEQYSFEVDLDACSGCKACVTACHSLNGLDEGESWRDVGLLISTDAGSPTQQTVTTACHHCADPACANGCPTLAYEKEADTGIVRHLDDQCIGCQYCTLTCPYEVPKYNARLGIVRKCDMCQSRLREGEAPACVQACPNEAIKIRIVSAREINERGNEGSLLPGTVPSRITYPSTRYVNLRNHPVPMVPATHEALRPAPAHTPLAIMLPLTQGALGILLFDSLSRFTGNGASSPAAWHALLGALLAMGGLVAATLHLGRPSQAWRSFLGWRKSWLSREILVFGPWAALSLAYAAALTFPLSERVIAVQAPLALSSIGTGMTGVFCSIMVYVFTRRPFWSFPQTATRFALTVPVLGAVLTEPLIAAAALIVKLVFEIALSHPQRSPYPRTARLLGGPLRSMWRGRLAAGGGGILLLLLSTTSPSLSPLAFIVVLSAEVLSASLFFRAVDAPGMPGGIIAK